MLRILREDGKLANFNDSFDILVTLEGGWTNSPSDTGSETYLGIRRSPAKDTYTFNAMNWALIDENKILVVFFFWLNKKWLFVRMPRRKLQ